MFENNPLFSKGLNCMLADMNRICGHINYRKNIKISHESFFGKNIMKVKEVKILLALIMQNFFVKKFILMVGIICLTIPI
jgi:hypothetical protein